VAHRSRFPRRDGILGRWNVSPPTPITAERFDAVFEEVKNWGRWGPDDELGTLNFITPEKVRAATRTVTSGQQVSLSLAINTIAGPDNPTPAIHHITIGHDQQREGGVSFVADFFGMAHHGDCHTHVDALCHVAYKGLVYGGRPATGVADSRKAVALDVTSYRLGLVGRGVLLDIPSFRGVKWLEPGEAVDRAELEAVEVAQGVRLGEGDILVFRTGHDRRRRELGPWDSSVNGQGRAGLDIDAIPWMHERRIAAFLPDGDGETIPSGVQGLATPIHPLQIAAMGMLAADSLQLEDLAATCREEGRYEFLVVGAPLMLPGGTGSPWNPVAIF
jgi:kynurenine formamidase